MSVTLRIGLTDQTSFVRHSSLTLKRDTLDVGLIDPAVMPALQDPVAIVGFGGIPQWIGMVSSIETYDLVNRPGHIGLNLTALSSAAVISSPAPFDLSDVPSNTTTGLELEDGSGHITLEDATTTAPGALLTEGALSYGYSGLSVKTTNNPGGATVQVNQLELENGTGHLLTEDGLVLDTEGSVVTVTGRCTVFQPGLWPGLSFTLTSSNQGYSATPFTISQVRVSFVGHQIPVYQVEFGDAAFTLNQLYAAR